VKCKRKRSRDAGEICYRSNYLPQCKLKQSHYTLLEEVYGEGGINREKERANCQAACPWWNDI